MENIMNVAPRGISARSKHHALPAHWISALIALALCLLTGISAKGFASTDVEGRPPNVLLLVADDLGYTDLGSYGGEIDTPNLDRLARGGVKFTSFYTAPTCSPTRAMLLTGRDPHEVGLGSMAEALHASPSLRKSPGYTGYLDPEVKTLADYFAGAGYLTAMAGKWHLGLRPEHGPKARGFERSFVLLQGGADHFGGYQAEPGQKGRAAANYSEDGQPARFPAGAYSSDVYTSKMLDYLTDESRGERPFFAYLAFTAPHWPVQAPEDVIDKYKGRYAQGPSALRRSRLAAMESLGFTGIENAAASVTDSDWDALDVASRRVASRAMEVYAAMVDNLDQNVGRVLQMLEERGELANTIIVFMSDNGAEGQSQQSLNYLLKAMAYSDEARETFSRLNADPATLGRPGSFYTYGPDWARVGTAPFSRFKSSTYEGGVRAPAFISGPGINPNRVEQQPVIASDILPTLLDLTDIAPDQTLPTGETAGVSWAGMLSGVNDTASPVQRTLAWELFFRRGVRIGDWKAVYSLEQPRFLVKPGAEGMRWRLFNLASDPGEQTDLARKHPDVLEELVAAWNRYAKAKDVTLTPVTH